jgi:hypothetical protein
MATMKAVLLESFGGAKALRVKEIDRPAIWCSIWWPAIRRSDRGMC